MGDDRTRLTIRLPTHTVEKLQDHLDNFNTEAARFQFLAQFYLDYKQLRGTPQPTLCPACDSNHTSANHESRPTESDDSQNSIQKPESKDGRTTSE
jgi:hypothetical protein